MNINTDKYERTGKLTPVTTHIKVSKRRIKKFKKRVRHFAVKTINSLIKDKKVIKKTKSKQSRTVRVWR